MEQNYHIRSVLVGFWMVGLFSSFRICETHQKPKIHKIIDQNQYKFVNQNDQKPIYN